MKALFYDPYLDTLGGGERYTFTAAAALIKHGWQVIFAWPNPQIFSLALTRFGLDLSRANVDPALFHLFAHPSSIKDKFLSTRDFDLIFFVSDGSVPTLFGQKNILHYQVPFTHTNKSSLINHLKLLTINQIVINSNFTKSVIDHTLGINRSIVLYPPVDTKAFRSDTTKQNIILNVGRFVSPSHPKRQDVLIEAFRQLNNKKWKLVLAGGHAGDDQPLKELQKSAVDLNVDFIINPEYSNLIKLFQQAKIYWHASGFEVDESLNPEAVEHFGITTVEAMAAGCVPVVIGKGGQNEIITPATGFLCDSINDITTATQELIDNPQQLADFSSSVVDRAQFFDVQRFEKQFYEICR